LCHEPHITNLGQRSALIGSYSFAPGQKKKENQEKKEKVSWTPYNQPGTTERPDWSIIRLPRTKKERKPRKEKKKSAEQGIGKRAARLHSG
jgi:hypothetical protein